MLYSDEVDALLGKRREHDHEVSTGMKTEFMSLWDGMDTDLTSKVVIMGATNRPQELDAAVLRRYARLFYNDFIALGLAASYYERQVNGIHVC